MSVTEAPGTGALAPHLKLECTSVFEKVAQPAVGTNSFDPFPLSQAFSSGGDNLGKCWSIMMVAHVADQKSACLQP
jgi:hypothetical protein